MSWYGMFIIIGILLSASIWLRITQNNRTLLAIYAGGLVGAFLGAKVAYFFAEGWLDAAKPDALSRILSGKSILGGLLGGYAGVEVTKHFAGYRRWTGDIFAAVVPIGLLIGRAGCLEYGCCPGKLCSLSWFSMADSLGVKRWPIVPLEMGFNLGMAVFFISLRKREILPGQHFHIYLFAYGVFRFIEEFLRDTPRIAGSFSGYHIIAVFMALFAIVRFRGRESAQLAIESPLAVR